MAPGIICVSFFAGFELNRFDCLPPPDLWPFIDRFWGCESDPVVAWPTLLPGTGAEIYLHYRRPFPGVRLPAHLVCLRTSTLPLGEAGDIGFIAIRFRIGMLTRFVPHPVGVLNDQVLDLEALWGEAGRDLWSRFLAAEKLAERLVLLCEFLRLQLRSGDALIEAAARHIYQQGAALPIPELAAASGLGVRQLERRFRAAQGISPSHLRGLVRFQKTCRQLLLNPADPILEVALAQGYYDQAHFCHHFRELSGLSPQAFFAGARAMTHFYNTPRSAAARLTTL